MGTHVSGATKQYAHESASVTTSMIAVGARQRHVANRFPPNAIVDRIGRFLQRTSISEQERPSKTGYQPSTPESIRTLQMASEGSEFGCAGAG